MICVECTYSEIDELYSKYKSDYIRLTICPQCGKVADKYIEFDKVILFLDLLLLKPQAYRHVAYNEIEMEIIRKKAGKHNGAVSEAVPTGAETGAGIVSWSIGGYWHTYRNLFRFIIMSLLFEVYITWAYEEKKLTHSEPMAFILSQEIYTQYTFFILKLVSEVFCLNFVIQYIFHNWFSWGQTKSINLPANDQQSYSVVVLLTTVLTSSSLRLFPILMLIWPYDNSTDSSLYINLVGFFNTVEAVKIVTNKTYLLTILAMVIATVLQQIVSKLFLGAVVSTWSGMPFIQLLCSEYGEFLLKLHLYENLIYKSLENAVNI